MIHPMTVTISFLVQRDQTVSAYVDALGVDSIHLETWLETMAASILLPKYTTTFRSSKSAQRLAESRAPRQNYLLPFS